MVPTRTRVLLWSAASGVLWALAWPAIGDLTPLAFFAWLPLLHAERLHDRRTAERPRAFVPYVLLAVFIWNASTSWWFFCVSEPLPTRLMSGFSPMVVNSLLMTLPWWMKRLVSRHVDRRAGAYSWIFFWLAFEYLHHNWDLQWPWFSLGNVFGDHPSWIQWYEFTGMLGGSLWILLFTLFADRAIERKINSGRGPKAYAIVASLILILPMCWSGWRYHTYEVKDGAWVEAVVVQPCVDPYTEKFGGLDPMDQLERMLTLTEEALTDSTRLVVMPETALQERTTVDLNGPEPDYHGLWENDLTASRSYQRLKAFQLLHPRVAILVGMSADRMFLPSEDLPASARPLLREDLPADRQRWYVPYNAAMFLPSKGEVEHYNKSKLVAGVESMPFEAVLGNISALSVDLGGTSSSLGKQEEREVLHDPANGLHIIPAICYESVFGEHIAAHVRNGGELIAILTNDAWWGHSPGYKQHLTFASIRAIETRRSVVRSANTGTSCFVDTKGTIHDASPWWVPTALRRSVQLNSEISFFVRHGDQIGRLALFCAFLSLALTLARWIRRPLVQ